MSDTVKLFAAPPICECREGNPEPQGGLALEDCVGPVNGRSTDGDGASASNAVAGTMPGDLNGSFDIYFDTAPFPK